MNYDTAYLCPNCVEVFNREIDSLENKMNSLYGKVEAAEYLDLHREYLEIESRAAPRELYCDFAAWVEESYLIVRYSCLCERCCSSFEGLHQMELEEVNRVDELTEECEKRLQNRNAKAR